MRGHYIEVDGPDSDLEVVEVLRRFIGLMDVEREVHGPTLVTLKDGRTCVFVDVDPGTGCDVLLAIGNLNHDDQARGEAARAIQRVLTLETLWRLGCSSDDTRDAFVMRRAC